MAIVTLLTDSGENDHYVAAIKAGIMKVNPGAAVVDLTHGIASCDIAHAAFVLRSVFRDFPTGTVHLVGVHATGNRDDMPIGVEIEDHFFVGSDNGLFGLISDSQHQQLVFLNNDGPADTTFPERDILAPAAAKLSSGIPLPTLGNPGTAFKRMI